MCTRIDSLRHKIHVQVQFLLRVSRNVFTSLRMIITHMEIVKWRFRSNFTDRHRYDEITASIKIVGSDNGSFVCRSIDFAQPVFAKIRKALSFTTAVCNTDHFAFHSNAYSRPLTMLSKCQSLRFFNSGRKFYAEFSCFAFWYTSGNTYIPLWQLANLME